MIHAECTCTSGSFFWHEDGCAALPPKEECQEVTRELWRPSEDEPLNVERENAAADYVRRWTRGEMKPEMMVGERVHDAFVTGAEWQASRAPQPTEDEREALRLAVQGVLWNASNYPERVQPHLLVRDVRPLTESVMAAILAAGFRRAPAEPAVQAEPTDAQVEAASVAAYRSGASRYVNMYTLGQWMRAALRAAFATRGTDDE